MIVPGGTAMIRSSPCLPLAVGAGAAAAVLRLPELAVDDLGQAVGAGDGAKDDVAAVAAVAAVGPARAAPSSRGGNCSSLCRRRPPLTNIVTRSTNI